MMTWIASVLLSTVLLILLLAIILLCWHPRLPERKKAPVQSTYHPTVLSAEESEERRLRTEHFQQEIHIRWPRLEMILDQTKLNDVLLFHWQGLHGKERVLFSITEEEAGMALFEAVSALNEASLIPDIDFWISLPLNDDLDAVSFETLEWMRSQKIIPDLVVGCRRNGLRDMPGYPGIQALIGIGGKPSVLYKVKGDNDEADWMASLHDETEPRWNEQAERMMHAMSKHMPWQLRLEMHFPFLHAKVMRDLMTLYPDTKEWFQARIDKRGDLLYLSANAEAILQETEEKVEASAREHSVHLEKIRANRMHLQADPSGKNCRRCRKAVILSMDVKAVLPVLVEKEENEEDYTPVETISFSPLTGGGRISPQGARSFYENFLRMPKMRP